MPPRGALSVPLFYVFLIPFSFLRSGRFVLLYIIIVIAITRVRDFTGSISQSIIADKINK